MGSFVAKRLGQAIPALLGVTLVVFMLLHASGDPTFFVLPQEASEEDRQAYRVANGLDKPLAVQYLRFVGNALRGDLGQSLAYKAPAFEVVTQRVPATVQLSLVSSTIAILIGIPIGVLAAVRRNSFFDSLVMMGATLGQSMAGFWLGLMLIMVFSVYLGWLPASGRGSWLQMVLPALTLCTWLLSLMARMTRSSMLEVMRLDYIRTAYAKGLTMKNVLFRHALRNATVPIISVLAISLSYQMGGSVIVETVFSWPGIGTLVLDSVLRRDYPVVLATTLFVALVFVTVNFAIDILYGVIDPRIRVSGAGGKS